MHVAFFSPILLLACASTVPASGGNEAFERAQPSSALTPDRVYSPTIRTVQCFKAGFELAAPIIELGSTEQVVLRFDDLAPDIEDLSYTLVHCDHAWQPSELPVGIYIEGASNASLTPARSSYNTPQPFRHYAVVVPTDGVRQQNRQQAGSSLVASLKLPHNKPATR